MTYAPETLRLAAELEACPTINYKPHAAELRRLHAEVEEQCRLNGMGQEREARLMAENEELRRTVRLIVDNVRRKDETND